MLKCSLNDLSETFAQVHEVQDLGNRSRLVVMAYRRIKIVNQIFEDANSKVEHGMKNTFSYCICLLHNKVTFYRNLMFC